MIIIIILLLLNIGPVMIGTKSDPAVQFADFGFPFITSVLENDQNKK